MKRLFAVRKPEADESLAGYFVRVTEANMVVSQRWMLDAIEEESGIPLPSLLDLLTNSDALAAFERIASLPAGVLTERGFHAYDSSEGTSLRLGSYHLLARHWMLKNDQVCPQCLVESPYLRQAWKLGHAPVCARHRSELLAACPKCQTQLRWTRTSVCHCGRCGFDLRRCNPPSVPLEGVVAAQLVQSWRSVALGTPQYDAPVEPDELHLLLCLMLPLHDGEPRDLGLDGELFALPVGRRVEALVELGKAWDGKRLDCNVVRESFRRRWYFLQAFERPQLYFDRWRFASGRLQVHQELRSLLGFGAGHMPIEAAEVYGGRPPSLMTVEQVAEFLGVAVPLVEEITSHLGTLQRPSVEEGYDADELLTARRFLGDLYSPDDVDAIAGSAGASSALASLGLIEPFGCGYGRLAGYVPSTLAVLFERIAEKIRPDLRSDTDQRLGDSLGPTEGSSELAGCVARVVSGETYATGWQEPFRLRDLLVKKPPAFTIDGAALVARLTPAVVRRP